MLLYLLLTKFMLMNQSNLRFLLFSLFAILFFSLSSCSAQEDEIFEEIPEILEKESGKQKRNFDHIGAYN